MMQAALWVLAGLCAYCGVVGIVLLFLSGASAHRDFPHDPH